MGSSVHPPVFHTWDHRSAKRGLGFSKLFYGSVASLMVKPATNHKNLKENDKFLGEKNKIHLNSIGNSSLHNPEESSRNRKYTKKYWKCNQRFKMMFIQINFSTKE